MVIGLEAFGRLQPYTVDFRQFQLWANRAHDRRRDVILKIEDVCQLTLETVCPKMRPDNGIDELARESQAVASLAHTAFQDVPHAKLPAGSLHIDGTAPKIGRASCRGRGASGVRG